jgi:hypothetical protein
LKAQRTSLSLIVLLLLSLGLPNAVAATKPKAAGRSSTAVINTVLNGKGAPSKSIGIDGDFYIDTRSLLISGPKAKGKWPTARSLQGANGANGVNGSNGSDGKNGNDAKNISTASNVSGPPGPQGEVGARGADGAAGSRGADGVNGANGSPGATGSSGSGATGATGSNGAPGLTGARGETGTAGVTEVRIGTLVFPNISGSVGSSSTSTLDGLKTGKSYLVRLLIYTYHPSDRFFDLEMPLNLTVAATSGSPVITKQYIASSAYSYRNGIEGFEWSIDAQLIIDGSLVLSDYGISVSIFAGKSTAAEAIAIDCSFSALLVGQVK